MDNKFPQGLIFKAPRPNSPDFVKGSISVKVSEFIQYLQQNQNNDWINIDMLLSKGTPEKPSKIYFKLNDWKPENNNAGMMNQGMQNAQAPDPVDEIPVNNIF